MPRPSLSLRDIGFGALLVVVLAAVVWLVGRSNPATQTAQVSKGNGIYDPQFLATHVWCCQPDGPFQNNQCAPMDLSTTPETCLHPKPTLLDPTPVLGSTYDTDFYKCNAACKKPPDKQVFYCQNGNEVANGTQSPVCAANYKPEWKDGEVVGFLDQGNCESLCGLINNPCKCWTCNDVGQMNGANGPPKCSADICLGGNKDANGSANCQVLPGMNPDGSVNCAPVSADAKYSKDSCGYGSSAASTASKASVSSAYSSSAASSETSSLSASSYASSTSSSASSYSSTYSVSSAYSSSAASSETSSLSASSYASSTSSSASSEGPLLACCNRIDPAANVYIQDPGDGTGAKAFKDSLATLPDAARIKYASADAINTTCYGGVSQNYSFDLFIQSFDDAFFGQLFDDGQTANSVEQIPYPSTSATAQVNGMLQNCKFVQQSTIAFQPSRKPDRPIGGGHMDLGGNTSSSGSGNKIWKAPNAISAEACSVYDRTVDQENLYVFTPENKNLALGGPEYLCERIRPTIQHIVTCMYRVFDVGANKLDFYCKSDTDNGVCDKYGGVQDYGGDEDGAKKCLCAKAFLNNEKMVPAGC